MHNLESNMNKEFTLNPLESFEMNTNNNFFGSQEGNVELRNT